MPLLMVCIASVAGIGEHLHRFRKYWNYINWFYTRPMVRILMYRMFRIHKCFDYTGVGISFYMKHNAISVFLGINGIKYYFRM
uniref:Putative secreted protein n=1 Tax=Anopheles darlingi TaxID=43151 RepID=A0A2M4D6H3_ANODA